MSAKIFAAMVAAQKAYGPALKASVNPHFGKKYADLAACIEAVIDALNTNGLALAQMSHESTGGVTVETVFLHEGGESWSAGKLFVPAEKQDPQKYGSALTYARRYSLMAACGIAPEDDDGNAASKGDTPRPAARAPQQPAPPLPTIPERIAKCGDLDALSRLWKSLSQQEQKDNVAAKDARKESLAQREAA